jgi:uncharacterized protein (TIGR02246 family)
MFKLTAISTIAVALSLAGVCLVNAEEDIRAQIEAANRGFEAAFARGDAAGVAACYTSDGMVLPPGAEAQSGNAAITAFWDAGMKSGLAKVKLITLEAERHGETAYEVGRAEIYDANDTLLDNAKYVVVWKRVDGNWKLHRDIFNSSAA